MNYDVYLQINSKRDIHPLDLIHDWHIVANLGLAIGAGLEPARCGWFCI